MLVPIIGTLGADNRNVPIIGGLRYMHWFNLHTRISHVINVADYVYTLHMTSELWRIDAQRYRALTMINNHVGHKP